MVPESFPGVLKLNTTNQKEPLLSKSYGRFSVDGIPEFEYFIKTLLSEVQPKRTRHKRLRGQETISKCFTTALVNELCTCGINESKREKD